MLPEATAKLQGQEEIKGTGGWLLALADVLILSGGVELTVASISTLVKKLTKVEGACIRYYAIPYTGDSVYKEEYEKAFEAIYNEVRPDIVHIHGTEFPHSLAALRACGSTRTVVSLQGLASVISQYYLAGLSVKEILGKPTLHDLLRMSLLQEKREMEIRGIYETQLIKEASYIIGRTNFDRTHVWAVNPDAEYYHCNEILRSEFYKSGEWSYEKCMPHSIFLSQGSYPLKGLHKVLEALPLVKRFFPDVTVRVAGQDITYNGAGIKQRIKISTYGRIIKFIIKTHHLENNVTFLGPLNAEEMIKEYLRANIFVCPSSIENSPNSLGEAQLLGVPCVASYAGGIPDFMKGCEEYLYRFDDVETMAREICKTFEDQKDIDTSVMRRMALKRHDVKTNVNVLMSIYRAVHDKAEGKK